MPMRNSHGRRRHCTVEDLHMWATAFLTSIPRITRGKVKEGKGKGGRPIVELPMYYHATAARPFPPRLSWNVSLYRVRRS